MEINISTLHESTVDIIGSLLTCTSPVSYSVIPFSWFWGQEIDFA